MAIDKSTLTKLERFATAFREARERGANESDTVMYLVKFFEELGGYDSLKGEISKELAIKDRYCDLALKIGGAVRLLVECKAAGIKGLVDKHIEQAENYASRAGLKWVLLTNGIEWKLFHLSFAEGEGITHDLAFEANLLDELTTNPEALWVKLGLLTRESLEAEEIEDYWSERKALSPASVVRALFSQDVLMVVRRELNRKAPARLDLEDVFDAVRDVLSKEAILETGEITVTKRRRKRRAKQADATTEEKVAEAASDAQVSAPPTAEVTTKEATQPQ